MLRSRALLLFVLCPLARAQSPLPDAPVANKDRIKPWSLSVGFAERWHDSDKMPHAEDAMVTVGVDYRLPGNRLRVGVGYGYAPRTGNSSVTAAAAFKLLEWGARR